MGIAWIALAIRAASGGAAQPAEPLELAWRFAGAITRDANDRARAQERVALADLARGAHESAVERAREIEGWRRGVVLAEVAAHLAERGDLGPASLLLAEAQSIGELSDGWRRDRVRVHVAEVRALLGLTDAVTQARRRYEADRDQRGRVLSAEALLLARQGRPREALALLDGLDDAGSYDTALWRARGYLTLAAKGRLTAEQAAETLDRAWTAAERIDGWRQWELQLEVVDRVAALHGADRAGTMLDAVSSKIAAAALPGHIRAPLMAEAARRWARAGDLARVEELSAAAADCIAADMQSIEQPSVLALFGEAHAAAGGRERAAALFGQAIQVAGALVNPRPRALACVDICLSLDRCGLDDERALEGLHALLAGFEAGDAHE